MASWFSSKALTLGLLGLLAVLPLSAPAFAQTTPALSDFALDEPTPLISTERDDPLLPWIPEDHMYDRKDAAQYWNLRYRGGRIQVGLWSDFMQYETVAGKDVPQVNNLPDPAVHGADVLENHINLGFGLVLYENIRLQFGLGASLINFRPDPDHPANPARDGYDRYGWGFNYNAQLGFAPILVFMPEFILPEFTIDWRQYVGKNIDGKGRIENSQIRADVKFYFELLKPGVDETGHSGGGLSFALFVGVGYSHLFGDLNGKEFSSTGGGASAVLGADVNLLAGLALTIDANWLLRAEFRTGNVTTVTVTLEVVGE